VQGGPAARAPHGREAWRGENASGLPSATEQRLRLAAQRTARHLSPHHDWAIPAPAAGKSVGAGALAALRPPSSCRGLTPSASSRATLAASASTPQLGRTGARPFTSADSVRPTTPFGGSAASLHTPAKAPQRPVTAAAAARGPPRASKALPAFRWGPPEAGGGVSRRPGATEGPAERAAVPLCASSKVSSRFRGAMQAAKMSGLGVAL
jgi:hypothetical protein